MKTLVIFYSLEGNTKLIAETIANETDADILELKPENEMKSKGFMKYVRGGKAAMTNKKPKLQPVDKNIDEYDLLFIGTPVWAGRYAPPINTFLSMQKINDKKIALFCCHGGGKGKIFTKLKEALGNNNFLGEADFKDPKKHNTETNIEKAKNWTQSIISDFR